MGLDRSDWEELGRDLESFRRNVVWREYADSVNRALLERWMGTRRWRRLLKTDAFDEAVGAGVRGLLASRAEMAVCMDVSTTVATHAAPAVVCDVRHLPFAAGTWDGVVSLSTLDHFPALEEIRRSLGEIHRTLAPGGRLFVTLDNHANPILWVRSRVPWRLLWRAGLTPYYVGASCGPQACRRLLEEAGFRVKQMRAIVHVPRVVALPLCGVLSRLAPPGVRRRAVRLLLALEWLDRLPSRWLTGHFLAAEAVKEG